MEYSKALLFLVLVLPLCAMQEANTTDLQYRQAIARQNPDVIHQYDLVRIASARMVCTLMPEPRSPKAPTSPLNAATKCTHESEKTNTPVSGN